MENDTKNYLKYKMSFGKKILLADEFHCQEDRKRRMPDATSSRKVFLKRQRTELVADCLQVQSATKTHAESSQKHDELKQKVMILKNFQKLKTKKQSLTLS